MESLEKHIQEDISELIKSNFLKLDSAETFCISELFTGFDLAELEMLFNPGKFITRKGKRVQIAYLRAAPEVYKLIRAATALKDRSRQTDQVDQINHDFRAWISITSQASELSFSCLEGLLNSSVVIIEKRGLEGLPLLKEWTEIGVSLSKKSNQFAIIYFNHTADIVTSYEFSPGRTSTLSYGVTPANQVNLENFREIINLGEKFASSNTKVAEAYFEHLPDMLALLSPRNFRFFYSIIDRYLNGQWAVAVDILTAAKDVFSTVPPQRRNELLLALDKFTEHINRFSDPIDRSVAFSFFKNAPEVMKKLNERDLSAWESTAKKIANISVDAAVNFLDKSPEVLAFLKIAELQKWAAKGIISLSSEKQAFESFYENSFRGLGKHIRSINAEERDLLLDTGVEIALINPVCTGSYFEYSPVALSLLPENELKVWADVGKKISKESSILGSGYFKNSVASFRNMAASYRREMLEIAESLLQKDWLLAGRFFESLPETVKKIECRNISKWVDVGTKVHDVDRNLAVDYFISSPMLFKELDVFELEEWALRGLEIFKDNTYLGRSYFSLKSRSSKDFIEELTGGVALKKVANILKYYAIGLSGVDFKIRSKKELPDYRENGTINPLISGRTIYLEPKIKKYGSFQDNFKIYKLSVMHEVGHAQFSSLVQSSYPEYSMELLEELLNQITEKYGTEKYGARGTGDSGKAENPEKAERTAEADRTERTEKTERSSRFLNSVFSKNRIDIPSIIAMFPNRKLAASILGVLEDARVEYLIMDLYRGVRSDLESIRHQMLLSRPVPEGELEKLMEALLWFSTLHEPSFVLAEDNRSLFDRSLLDSIRNVLQNRVLQKDSSILTSLEATFAVYNLFKDLLGPLESREYEVLMNLEYRGMGSGSFSSKDRSIPGNHRNVIHSFIPDSESFSSAEKKRHENGEPVKEKLEKIPSYAADRNWKILGSYRYDEWDSTINDYRPEWCSVNEIEPVGGSGIYYTSASERYRNEIALIKNVFTRMKPESFRKLKGQKDGTEIDIDAFSNSLIERRCGINPDEKLYVRWDKSKRDVATLFLVDVSASTRKRLLKEAGCIEERRNIGEGQSIIDVEKDALVIMTQALETIGDRYSIYAFSGHTKEDVEYYVIKEFGEELSDDVKNRISLLEPIANTRLGAAIRHSVKKLEQVNSRTKILILLSDGEPYDTCYGEGAYQEKYAEEDTKIAIQEGNAQGIHFFCITVDSSPGDYLDRIFSGSRYTIIDDARKLPESLPIIYKRITT